MAWGLKLPVVWNLSPNAHNLYILVDSLFLYSTWTGSCLLQVLYDSSSLELVSEALAKLTNIRRYSLSRLQQRPLPEEVDALKLETYLIDEEFQVSYLRIILKYY